MIDLTNNRQIQNREMNQQVLKQFMEICGTSKTAAQKLLAASDWDIEKAVGVFLAADADPKLVKLFTKYREDEDHIGIDGTLAYLADLGIEPEDVRSLILACFLESSEMGQFDKRKFLQKWTQKGITSLAGMKSFLDKEKQRYATDFEAFRDLYEFTFTYLLEKENQKFLAADLTIDYWKLLFGLRNVSDSVQQRLDQWYQFVARSERGVSHDTYSMWLYFVHDVIEPDPLAMKDYNELSSWPSAMDEYVEHLVDNGWLEMELQY